MGALKDKLEAALNSRDERRIRRRLPDPTGFDSTLIDFNSNDYLSLSKSPVLREAFLAKLNVAPEILGSGGSRLLVNGEAHSRLETRLAKFFDTPAALLFNSGFDANVGFFSCIPQPGDVIVCDEYIHASVHDGIRASRAREGLHLFKHNCMHSFRLLLMRLCKTCPGLRSGQNSLFVAVESLYSMDGTFAPLHQIVSVVEELFPNGNGHIIVDEAHATGIYGPKGRGFVASLGLQSKVLARLHTFGKALAGTGAVLVTSTLIKDYLLNYARPLIFTTSLSNANIIGAECSFDMLEDKQAQEISSKLLDLSNYLVQTLRPLLATIPPDLLCFPEHLQHSHEDDGMAAESPPSPIIPIMTPHPHALSNFLLSRNMNARPITWPTVPKGMARIRVCLHAGNSRYEVDALIEAIVAWAHGVLRGRRQKGMVDRINEMPLESKL